MSEVVESFKTPSGTVIRRTRDSNGQERWRTENGEFRSDAQVDAIKQNSAKRSVTENDPSLNIDYVVTPTDEQDRRNAVEIEYPYITQNRGIDPNKPQPGKSFDNRVRGWMGNQTLRKQVQNDPLLRTRKERDEALEAKARQVANDLKNANSEKDAIEILRKYDIY